MNKELLNVLIKRLEENINEYGGDYGTLDSRLEETLNQILNIIKVMNEEMPFEDWYIKDLLGDKEDE